MARAPHRPAPAALAVLAEVWRKALEHPGAAARLAALLLESTASPGVLALEVAFGEGERRSPASWRASMARALAEHGPLDWLDVVRGGVERAA